MTIIAGGQIRWTSAWLWLGLASMAFATLHIFIDAGVGLFDLHGQLTLPEGAVLVLISVIQVWWVISIAAGMQGNGGGIAAVAVLGLGWTSLTNGFPIVYCPPTCSEAAPLSDVAHVGSIAFGVLAAIVVVWTLWRQRIRVTWTLPLGALLLSIATMVALAQAGPA